VQANWNTVLQTLDGYSAWVNSVAFSPDGTVAVSRSSDETIQLWGVATGAALQTLEGHSSGETPWYFHPTAS